MSHPVAEAWGRHVNPTFVQLLGVYGYGRVFVRADGVRLWDSEGREYLDALAGFGASVLGHSHPRLLRRATEHLASGALGLNHVGPAPEAAALAERLAAFVGHGLTIAMFGSDGADAVEGALKLAHLCTGRAAYAHCIGGFHGTSLGTLPVMGTRRLRGPFAALLPPERAVPFGDSGALRKALDRGDVAAFVVEPVLAEGGVLGASWWREVQEACRRAGTFLVVDEVQTGLGRTGRDLCFPSLGLEPDAVCLGKALGGGLVAVSATMVRPEHHARAFGRMDRFDLHGSTYAGSALGMVVGDEVLRVLADERLSERAAVGGDRLLKRLRAGLDGHPLVKEVRGFGLLVGIELGPTGASLVQRWVPGLVSGVAQQVLGQWAALRLLEAGVVAQPASQRWEVLRIEPPLVIGEPDVDAIAERVISVLRDLDADPGTLKDVASRVWSQWSAGWAFR